MASIKGTQTEKNLLTAFAGESQARNRYTYFASIAKNDGYVLVQDVFLETANHEKEHAKRLFKFLEGDEVEITAAFPAGVLAGTVANLHHAAEGENYEHTTMYPQFADVAQKEGFSEIASVFRSIANAEAYHEARYLGLAKQIEENSFFKKTEKVVWRCRNCGYRHEGLEAPALCPACKHPQAHYEVYIEPW